MNRKFFTATLGSIRMTPALIVGTALMATPVMANSQGRSHTLGQSPIESTTVYLPNGTLLGLDQDPRVHLLIERDNDVNP
jgi:hypothetical protein